MIEFNCVYAKDALSIRKFLRNATSDDTVNYMEITNKLTKNDIYSKEPSDTVINSYIIKYLEKSITEKDNRTFFYVFSSLDKEIIESLMDYVEDLAQVVHCEVVFNMYLKDEEDKLVLPDYFDKVLEMTL